MLRNIACSFILYGIFFWLILCNFEIHQRPMFLLDWNLNDIPPVSAKRMVKCLSDAIFQEIV
jgi:hypothetical protein